MTCVKGTVSWGRAFQPVGSVLPPSTPRQNATGLWDTQWVPRRLVSELPLTLEKTFRRGRVSAQQTLCLPPGIRLTHSSVPSTGWVCTLPVAGVQRASLVPQPHLLLPTPPDTPTVLLALVSQRSPPRLAEVQGQTAYRSHTKFWVFSRLSFQRAAHMGCWGAGPSV